MIQLICHPLPLFLESPFIELYVQFACRVFQYLKSVVFLRTPKFGSKGKFCPMVFYIFSRLSFFSVIWVFFIWSSGFGLMDQLALPILFLFPDRMRQQKVSASEFLSLLDSLTRFLFTIYVRVRLIHSKNCASVAIFSLKIAAWQKGQKITVSNFFSD